MVRVKGEFKKLKVHKAGLGMTTRTWSFRTLSAPASENSELVIRSCHVEMVAFQLSKIVCLKFSLQQSCASRVRRCWRWESRSMRKKQQ